MKKWYRGVTGLYLILITLSFMAWLSFGADTLKLFSAYVYPYPTMAKGFGDVSFIPIIIFQVVVISSYLASLFINKNKYVNIIASVSAVLWFILVSSIMFVSILH